MPELYFSGSLSHAAVLPFTIQDYQLWKVWGACPYQMKYLQAVPFQNKLSPNTNSLYIWQLRLQFSISCWGQRTEMNDCIKSTCFSLLFLKSKYLGLRGLIKMDIELCT